MRNTLLGCAALAALIALGSAQAADLGPRPAPVYKAPAMVSQIYNWTGFYIGIEGGGIFGRSQHCDTSAFCTSTFDVNGGEVGGTFGYNWQIQNFVLGVETDISWADAKGTTSTVPGVFGCGATGSCFTHLDWFGTARGRVGVAFDRFLPYVTGGFAYGGLKSGFGSGVDNVSDTKTGWTAGGGLEYAITPQNWSVKVEYLYMHLGNEFYDVQQVCGQLSCTATHNNFNIVRAGVNYRF